MISGRANCSDVWLPAGTRPVRGESFDSFCRRLAAANTELTGQSFLAKGVRFQLLLIRISAVFEAPMPSVDAIAIPPTTPTRQTPWRSARVAGIRRFFGLSGRVRTSGLGLTGPCRSRH